MLLSSRIVSRLLLIPALFFLLAVSSPGQVPHLRPLKARKAEAPSKPKSTLPDILGATKKRVALTGVPCPYVPPALQWIPKPMIEPSTWQSVAGDFGTWHQLAETLGLGTDIAARAKALQDETVELRDRDAAITNDLERLHSLQEKLIRDDEPLGAQICAHNAEVRRYDSECLGRELPEPEYQRCTSWQSQLNTRKASLDSQKAALEQRFSEAESTRLQLVQDQQALITRIHSLDDKSKAFANAATDAARRRTPTNGYEIDASSFIQLADKEAGWEKVQNLLLNNRGKVFISEAAESEVLNGDNGPRDLARRALMQQWNIRPAASDVPLALVELFANLGVSAKRDAEIAASAWKHLRILITGNPQDFRPVVFPKFPFLVIEITKGRLAPVSKRKAAFGAASVRDNSVLVLKAMVWRELLGPGSPPYVASVRHQSHDL